MTTVLEAIGARERAATPGPWANFPSGGRWSRPGIVSVNNDVEPAYPGICRPPEAQSNSNDMEFIAAARSDIPLLLAVARALVALVDEEPIIEDMDGWYCSICGASSTESGRGIIHRPDCDWLRAKQAIAPLMREVTE